MQMISKKEEMDKVYDSLSKKLQYDYKDILLL